MKQTNSPYIYKPTLIEKSKNFDSQIRGGEAR